MSEKPAAKRVEEEAAQQLQNLRSAVESLYYSAVWHADRPVDEAGLWTAVRDAAGFRPGNSPEELPYSGLRVEYSLSKLRQIATTIRKDRSNEFSTGQTAAFLDLYREDLEARVNDAVRKFLEEKLG